MPGIRFISGFTLLTILQVAMCTSNKSTVAPDAKDFFAKSIDGNLTKITWAHAVNSKAKLLAALGNEKVMMLEADVVIGNLKDTSGNASENIPIMAHPPDVNSDLSLDEFLENILEDGKRGIKLDFKSLEAFNESRHILEKHRANMSVPVWLNADILPGPVDAGSTDTKPVDPTGFLNGAAASLPESTLSIGWTTRYGSEFNITEGNYTMEQIKNMIDTVGKSKTVQSVTYPVRAGLAANANVETFTNLLKTTSANNPTLTIWSSPNDTVDTAALSKLIKEVGVDRVYIDLPEEVLAKLNISGARSLAAGTAVLLATLMTNFIVTKFI